MSSEIIVGGLSMLLSFAQDEKMLWLLFAHCSDATGEVSVKAAVFIDSSSWRIWTTGNLIAPSGERDLWALYL